MTINMITFGVFTLSIFCVPISFLKIYYKDEQSYKNLEADDIRIMKQESILMICLSVFSQLILMYVYIQIFKTVKINELRQ